MQKTVLICSSVEDESGIAVNIRQVCRARCRFEVMKGAISFKRIMLLKWA